MSICIHVLIVLYICFCYMFLYVFWLFFVCVLICVFCMCSCCISVLFYVYVFGLCFCIFCMSFHVFVHGCFCVLVFGLCFYIFVFYLLVFVDICWRFCFYVIGHKKWRKNGEKNILLILLYGEKNPPIFDFGRIFFLGCYFYISIFFNSFLSKSKVYPASAIAFIKVSRSSLVAGWTALEVSQ